MENKQIQELINNPDFNIEDILKIYLYKKYNNEFNSYIIAGWQDGLYTILIEIKENE